MLLLYVISESAVRSLTKEGLGVRLYLRTYVVYLQTRRKVVVGFALQVRAQDVSLALVSLRFW